MIICDVYPLRKPFRGRTRPAERRTRRPLNGSIIGIRRFGPPESLHDLCSSRTWDRRGAACVVPDSSDKLRSAARAAHHALGVCLYVILNDDALDLA